MITNGFFTLKQAKDRWEIALGKTSRYSVAYFRVLRSLWFKDGQEVEFKRLHQGCKKLRDDENTMVVNRRLYYAEAVYQYNTKATSAEDVVTKHDGTLDARYQLNGPGKGTK